MRPEANPSHSLATTLLQYLEPDLSETDWLLERSKLSQALENEALSLEDIVARILQKRDSAAKLLLVIDQFEELYTLVPDQRTRQRFIDTLLAAGKSANSDLPFNILLTMRADFLRIPVKTITHSGRCRSLRPDDVDHPFRLMAITRERTTLAAKSYR